VEDYVHDIVNNGTPRVSSAESTAATVLLQLKSGLAARFARETVLDMGKPHVIGASDPRSLQYGFPDDAFFFARPLESTAFWAGQRRLTVPSARNKN
jgi:hypothetical protein